MLRIRYFPISAHIGMIVLPAYRPAGQRAKRVERDSRLSRRQAGNGLDFDFDQVVLDLKWFPLLLLDVASHRPGMNSAGACMPASARQTSADHEPAFSKRRCGVHILHRLTVAIVQKKGARMGLILEGFAGTMSSERANRARGWCRW